jgi:hypothetical protein
MIVGFFGFIVCTGGHLLHTFIEHAQLGLFKDGLSI